MALVQCLQSQVLTSSSSQQAILCEKSSSCSPRLFLVPITSSSFSSFLAAPNHASSSLLFKRLSSDSFLGARLSKISSHTKNVSGQRYLRTIVQANDSTADEPLPSDMSLENALQLLGVREGASFEEILRAKKVMTEKSGGDQEQIVQVEAAYDMLLMQSLSQRRAGKVVDSAVRYADVRKPKSSGGGPEWLQKALKNAPVSFETPSNSELGLQSGLYAALIVWTFATGVTSSPIEGALAGQDTPGFILAVGFGLAVYFLRKKNTKLAKAVLISIGGLVSGAVLGGLVESWLRVDIVPVFGIGSPAIVVSEFVLFSLWFSSLYLR
ncbi:protein CHAPERONE-LIKE PROTEIN OF POR1, chloroplastic [Physcomitrium patens]|uniref:Uncharacterized protein n=1 Tax=Physcomitrium patens TaxID=3218 RepID=A0A2K1JZX0_PHYPA|nr:protein CHAPERONE-LIKE PROTEIN OF POR1, chloroplastic-like [Physcomitrium patens]XP_024387030.1 protein CHAPERONE-LIKE PROTEIN OF POR1, chloroplastic-like [Physcomitrium patens]XP_024387031.1 protein CHAPERONE-LIKE PROTEIN OF POR1, chloroplastic-like [Physcomitrium patens]PNR47068.1 hypothetical protein PHYPA_014188 [Physcomitrium patens]|eukprot:XP_024387029.1 protein CHAPERONE-LIKE PROTEIN OF POR1, chloroplastic-like [Physcomitrella patens]